MAASRSTRRSRLIVSASKRALVFFAGACCRCGFGAGGVGAFTFGSTEDARPPPEVAVLLGVLGERHSCRVRVAQAQAAMPSSVASMEPSCSARARPCARPPQ
eukprot:6008236-Prymnesium_polylepis.1